MNHKEFRIRIPWPTARQVRPAVARWLPSRGNVLFTTLMILMLVWAQTAGAFPALNSAANSTGTIAYQGRLADSSGNPLTNTLNMSFRLYSSSTGGSPLWSEQWTGSNGVQVSDGLFNVMLGSLTPIPQNVIAGNSTLFLGITVGTDDEMAPRVQLGSVPFAVQALTVPNGSITTAKLATQASTQTVIVNSTEPDSTDARQLQDMVDMTATMTTSGGPVWINFHMQFKVSAGDGAGTVVMLNIDGQDIIQSQTVARSFQANQTSSLDLSYLAELPAGEHTFIMRWRMSTANPAGSVMQTYSGRQMAITEFKR